MTKRPGKGGRRAAGPPRRSENIALLYEDDTVVAINKPAGLAAVPVKGSDALSAYSLLSAQLRSKRQRAFVVHRIDRFTSGIMLFAKTERDRDVLVRQFLGHTPVRQYLAVIRGHLSAPEGTLIHYFRRAECRRSRRSARGTAVFSRAPSAGRYASPRDSRNGTAEPDTGAILGHWPSRCRRPEVPSGRSVGAADRPRCASCRASRVRPSTYGQSSVDRLRSAGRFPVSHCVAVEVGKTHGDIAITAATRHPRRPRRWRAGSSAAPRS